MVQRVQRSDANWSGEGYNKALVSLAVLADEFNFHYPDIF